MSASYLTSFNRGGIGESLQVKLKGQSTISKTKLGAHYDEVVNIPTTAERIDIAEEA